MIHPVILFYAGLCAGTLWAANRSSARDRGEAIIAAVVLTAGCLLSNFAWLVAAVGNWKRIDAAVMMLLMWLAWRSLRPWKLVLAGLAIATMAVHALFETLDDRMAGMMYAYPAALNAIFVLQLLTVASNGAKGVRENGIGRLDPRRTRNAGDDSDPRG